ncbi:hypothetical protein V3Q90_02045 [Flavobacterium oreochromis]|uniref:hypothetical protein n=1 Tax=Flavobacterium oreochromis TaxID=2906078 RepID=UPI003858023B
MSNKFSNIKERILYLAEKKEVSKQVFFKKIGMSYGNFTGKAKETPINSTAIENILLNYPDTNPEWLITGNGEMFKKENNLNETRKGKIFNKELDEKIMENQQYLGFSEVEYLRRESPEELKNETKLFMILYMQRISDTMILLKTLCAILKTNGYEFNRHEINEVKYYEHFFESLVDIENGKIPLTTELKSKLITILDSSFFSIINKYCHKIEVMLKIERLVEWEEFLSPQK